MSKMLLLFDCDETLWTSEDKDYVSSVSSPFQKADPGAVVRVADGKMFSLKHGVREAFTYLQSQPDVVVGIVSDNLPESVKDALQAFDLWRAINHNAFNVRLWQGYCPKHIMVSEVLDKPTFRDIALADAWWFDDKDYAAEALAVGVHFVRAIDGLDIEATVKKIVS